MQMDRTAGTARRSDVLPIAAFLIALAMTAATGLVALWWNAIDERYIRAADDAGWDESLLLPHQTGLTAAVDGALLLSVLLSAVTLVALIRLRRSDDAA